MQRIQLDNVIYKEGKYYVAQCLNVNVSSFGTSKHEALKNLEEALELYFEDNDHPQVTKISNPEIVSTELVHA